MSNKQDSSSTRHLLSGSDKRTSWLYVILTLFFSQAMDITLRIASVEMHFTVGAILQAVPLMILSVLVLGKQMIGTGVGMEGRKRAGEFFPATLFWLLTAAYGIMEFVLGNVFYFLSVKTGGLTIASPSQQSQAIWAVLIGGLLLKEKISRQMVIGIVLFAIGMTGLFYYKSLGETISENWRWAFVFGLLGGLFWTGATAMQRYLLSKKVPAFFILAVGATTGIAALVLLIFTVFGREVWQEADVSGIWKMLLAGCFFCLSMLCFVRAVSRIHISKLIPVISIGIVLNTFNGAIFFGEYINAGTVLSSLVIFLGVVILQEPKLPGLGGRKHKGAGMQ